MNLEAIIAQLLINKYKGQEVTVELAKKIETELQEMLEEVRDENLPQDLPGNTVS